MITNFRILCIMGTMKTKTIFTPEDVSRISNLAHIPVTDKEEKSLASDFTKTIEVINELSMVTVENSESDSLHTGLENVLREDEVDAARTFTQDEALMNAKRTHNGFFVVPRVLDK